MADAPLLWVVRTAFGETVRDRLSDLRKLLFSKIVIAYSSMVLLVFASKFVIVPVWNWLGDKLAHIEGAPSLPRASPA